MNVRDDKGCWDGVLSIVLPVHNEAEVIRETHARLTAIKSSLKTQGLEYELIFVNDGSTDGTDAMLDAIAADDDHVRVVHLTRNFGHQAAVTAGLTLARGGVVAIMDSDLQDPPELLPRFLAKWKEGFQVVYGIRKRRKEWFGKRLAYWAFYRLLASISDVDIPLDSGDFCVLDRSAVNLLNSLPEKQRFVRGLRSWIGLKQVGIDYERSARWAGMASYQVKDLMKLAVDGFVGFSAVPLKLVMRLGFLGLFAALGLGAWVIAVKVFGAQTPPGWASLACLVLFLSSIQLLSLGIIGEYLGRIFVEVKGRPTFLIARVVDAHNVTDFVQVDVYVDGEVPDEAGKLE